MKKQLSSDSKVFDEDLTDYDAELAQGISVSGEDKGYFVRGRVQWMADLLKQLDEQPKSVMDFGCGTGAAMPYLFELIRAEQALGVDSSVKLLELARKKYGSERTNFLLNTQYQPSGQIDLAICNGVFHHIPVSERSIAVDYVYRSLRSGGLFAFWENNPWNPGTRYVMNRIPFDRDAITLTAREARGLLRSSGFEILRTQFLFIFPRMLRCLRGIERFLSRLPRRSPVSGSVPQTVMRAKHSGLVLNVFQLSLSYSSVLATMRDS